MCILCVNLRVWLPLGLCEINRTCSEEWADGQWTQLRRQLWGGGGGGGEVEGGGRGGRRGEEGGMGGEQHTVEGKVPWQPQESQSGTSPGLTDGQTGLRPAGRLWLLMPAWAHTHINVHLQTTHTHKHTHRYKHRNADAYWCTKNTRNAKMADQHRDRSWARDKDKCSPSLKTNPQIHLSALFYFRAELCQRLSEAICSEGVKVNQVQRFLFLRFRTVPKNRREHAGHWLVCRSACLCCSTHVGHKRTVLAEMWDVQWSLWRQEGDGGRIQSELTICQITCNAKGVIPLCNFSRPGECGTHGKPPTKSHLLYRDMHFLGFNVARCQC